MTQDEIIEMAREAVRQNTILDLEDVVENDFLMLYFDELEAFAKLVEEKATAEANARANASWALMCKKMVGFEREACAKVADQISDKYGYGYYGNEVDTADEIAAAIRARGEQA